MIGLLVGIGLVLLALLTPRYGVDSRDGRDWSDRPRDHRHAPEPRGSIRADLRAVLARVRGAAFRRWRRQELAWASSLRTQQPWIRSTTRHTASRALARPLPRPRVPREAKRAGRPGHSAGPGVGHRGENSGDGSAGGSGGDSLAVTPTERVVVGRCK